MIKWTVITHTYFIFQTSEQYYELIASVNHRDRTETNYLKYDETNIKNVSGRQDSFKWGLNPTELSIMLTTSCSGAQNSDNIRSAGESVENTDSWANYELNVLSYRSGHPHSTQDIISHPECPVWALAIPFLNELPMCLRGNRCWFKSTYGRTSDGILDLWLEPDPGTGISGMWRVISWMGSIQVFFIVFLLLCLSST